MSTRALHRLNSHATFISVMYTKCSMPSPQRCVSRRYRWPIACLLLTAGLTTHTGAQSLPVEPLIQPEQPAQPTRIDRLHTSMADSVNIAARWFDSFFEDERYIAEEASSRIRLRPSLLLQEGESAKLKFSVGARLNVPRFNRKLKLVISDEGDSTTDNLDSRRFTTPESNETNIGLQFILHERDRLNTNITSGVKLGGAHGVDFFIGPRVRKTWRLDLWQLRFTERIRWYTDIGWESQTRLDLERVIHNTWFFRSTLNSRAREDDYRDSGLRYDLSPALTHQLNNRTAIEYKWSTSFVTRPRQRIEETGFRLRFRQQFWRDWLFYEINPQLVFRNNDDFRATPGIEFRLEASFGGLDVKPEKTVPRKN
ncbi:hypothetical protein MNBD_GAMMA14-1538 [hydrothermal vent metagenome]|uniref:Uncharacterized protein n=1 Tax=hydrothermal vent metagenome TaxID=652676 RepID=A0A3B0Z360_9ZZZZ